MAVINSCCCWFSLKVGSFICGFYTMIYYSIMVIAGFFNVDTWDQSLSNATLSMYSLGPYADDSYPLFIAAVTSSGITALTSIILLIGVFLENRLLLLPWIVSLIVTTLIGFILTVFVLGIAVMHPIFPFMATFDLFICLLNIYCALCVISLYQDYKSRRTRNGHDNMQYEKGNNSSCDVNSYKRSMTLTESDRPSRDPNSNQRRCSSPHQPAAPHNARRLSSASNANGGQKTAMKVIVTNDVNSVERQPFLRCYDVDDDVDVKSSAPPPPPTPPCCNLEVKHLGNGNERRRSSSSATKHVQFHPTIEETPHDNAANDNDLQRQLESNGKRSIDAK